MSKTYYFRDSLIQIEIIPKATKHKTFLYLATPLEQNYNSKENMESFEIWKPLEGDVEGVRKTFKHRMQKLYDGWKDEFDSQWDKNSFLFVLKKNGEYIATCRIIIKRYHNIIFQVPMENASIQSYDLSEYFDICAEGGMVSFKDLKSFRKLMYCVASWAYENEVDYLFTCYDIGNTLIRRLYVDTLNFEKVENVQLIYGGFSSKKYKKEVKWQVVRSDKEHGRSTMDKLTDESDFTYETGKYPRLNDWIKERKTD